MVAQFVSEGEMNNRRRLIVALGVGALACSLDSFAQQQGKVWRVGVLSVRRRPDSLDSYTYEAFADGMRELGHVVERNLVIEWRFADDKRPKPMQSALCICTRRPTASADAAKVRAQLLTYTEQRILFYTTYDNSAVNQINAKTMTVQKELWAAIVGPSTSNPTPVMALVTAGMNDVLNSQGYTQAAWWNRIPVAAWGLMGLIAICSNLLVGYGARKPKEEVRMLLILPLIVAVAFFLIADIDSPRGGLIHVVPQNLISLAQSLRTQ